MRRTLNNNRATLIKVCLIFVSTLLMALNVSAQYKIWTLEDCIEHALKHNIEVKRQEIAIEIKRETLSQTKWNFAPSVSAGSSYSIASGRVLDETTYDFIENTSMRSSTTSISGNMELFSGFRKYREFQRAKLELKAEMTDLETIRQDLFSNVVISYIELLCAKESIIEAEQIESMLKIQAEKTAIKVETGKITSAEHLQILSLLYNAQNDVLSAKNNYYIAKLNLCQLLEIYDFKHFEIATPETIQTIIPKYSDKNIYDIISLRPEIKSAQLKVDISRKNLQIANSAYWPSISLSAGYGSSYSDAREKTLQNSDGTFRYEAYPFFRQYADNASSYVSISLNIPIFSNLTTKKNVKLSHLALHDAEYALVSVRKKITKELMQLLIDVRTAESKYDVAIEQAKYAEEILKLTNIKYNAGTADIISYTSAISELASVRYKTLSAKYELMLTTKLLMLFYRYNYNQ